MAVNDSITEPEVSNPCSEDEPPTGVILPITDCQVEFSENMTPEQSAFLEENPEVSAAIQTYLFKKLDCEEAIDFVNWAIDYLIENPETPVELVLTARYLDCLKVNQLASVFPNAPTENIKV